MKKLLHINAAARGEASRTLALAQTEIERICRADPEYEVEEVHLYRNPPAFVDANTIACRDAGVKAGDFSHPVFAEALRFRDADYIVVTAPYWDLSFPAILKAYLESVSIAGVTFEYMPSGCRGKCKAKGFSYLTTAGGTIGDNDFGWQYVNGLFSVLFGIGGGKRIARENLDL